MRQRRPRRAGRSAVASWGLGRAGVPRSITESWGPFGSRDIDATGQRTRSFNHSSERFGPITARRSSIAFDLCRGDDAAERYGL